ncbi:MAG: hypothetical protein M1820_000696 [Bogoriella megaspora]|nr:MAG: hypothetical protein M1820_000696 [Bogoriella megaspora]
MSQWNENSDFWMPLTTSNSEPQTAQAWANEREQRQRKQQGVPFASNQSGLAYQGLQQNPNIVGAQGSQGNQSNQLQWQEGLDLFSGSDMYGHNPQPSSSQLHPHAQVAQPAQAPHASKASKLLGDMSYSQYAYSQPGITTQSHPQQAIAGGDSGLDAYAPLPKEYQNFLTGGNGLSISGFDPYPPASSSQDAYNLGTWAQHQQMPQVSGSSSQFHPVDASRPDVYGTNTSAFDTGNSTFNNGFNFQFNDHSDADLPEPGPLDPPTLQFHPADLTTQGTTDFSAAHLSHNFAMPTTETYHGIYDPQALPMGHDNIGLAIAGPPTGFVPHDPYAMPSLTPMSSEGGPNVYGKSVSPRTTETGPHRGRIPSDAKAVLEQHFEANAYPTKEEVEQLANKLGLKPKTVKNWFGNTRQRRPCSEPNDPEPGTTVTSEILDAQGKPIPIQLTKQHLDNASLSSGGSSIDRFANEPVEEGHVPLETLEKAAPTYKTFLALNNPEELAQQHSGRPSAPRSVASSNGDSTGASSTSGASGLSSGSAKSATSLGRAPRRGRRRYRHNPYGTRPKDDGKPLEETQGGKTTKYHCTWCFARFARPYEWKRHQETLHVPRQVWVCTPSAKKDDLKPPQMCPYCMKLYPDEQHLQEHNYYTCAKKSTSKRTFARKDHLFQHIRQVHLKNADEEQLNQFSEWKGEAETLPAESRALWCGFCRRYHSTWEKRVKDVARHFGEGEDLSTWWDPDVGWLRPSRYKESNLPLTVKCRCCPQPKSFDNQQDARRHYESTGEPWQLELDLTRMRFHTRDEVDKHRTYMSMRTPPKHFWSCYQLQDLSGCITPAGSSFTSPRASPASPVSPSSAVPLDTCNFCGEPFPPDADYGARIEHVEGRHALHLCRQTKFYDPESFRSHLKHHHKAGHGDFSKVLEKHARREERDPPVRLERSPSVVEAALEMQGVRSFSSMGGEEGKRPKLLSALSGVTRKFSSFRKGAG